MATPTLRPPYGVSSPYTVDDPGVLKNPFGLGTGGGGGTGPAGPSGHGSTTTTAAPSASGGNWVFTVADTTAFNAAGLPIYCSDGTNSIRGHVVSVASSTQLTVAPDSTSGTISSITNGSTFTFSGATGGGGTSITNAGDLPGIIDWWRADLGTNTTTNGANVSSWAGQKGVYTFSATSGHYPTYVTSAVSGHPALAFNGSNQFMSCASVALSTFCILVFFKATGTAGIICEHSVNANSNNGCFLYGTTASTMSVRRTSTLDTKNLYGNWAVDGNWHSVIYTHSGGVIGHRISIDGFDATASSGVSSNPDNTSTVTDTLYLMMRAGSTLPVTGSLAEFAICSGPLTTAYRRAWFDYINSRYGTAF